MACCAKMTTTISRDTYIVAPAYSCCERYTVYLVVDHLKDERCVIVVDSLADRNNGTVSKTVRRFLEERGG